MRWLGEAVVLYWVLTAALVVFLAPFVALAVLISYVWGML
mgnify:CR=1 FL=1